MLPNRTIQRLFLAAAVLFELLLALASTLYLGVASVSFYLVIVVVVFSIIGIVIRVREIDRRDQQTLYGQLPPEFGR